MYKGDSLRTATEDPKSISYGAQHMGFLLLSLHRVCVL